jgi:hypothetical protein
MTRTHARFLKEAYPAFLFGILLMTWGLRTHGLSRNPDRELASLPLEAKLRPYLSAPVCRDELRARPGPLVCGRDGGETNNPRKVRKMEERRHHGTISL